MRTIHSRSLWLFFGLLLTTLTLAPTSSARVAVSITIAPPALPVYVQPACPGDGYIWTPGYWAWGDDGYYWVPGTWVLAPEPGLLWTPGYWAWGDGVYIWHAGYWGPRVGFYGGINYGFGYFGVGFSGGYWHEGRFFYNRSVSNVNVTVVHNVYNKTVINQSESHVSFNGGRGGIHARPNSFETAAARERHVGATSWQQRQQREASSNRSQFANVNHGRPNVAATARPAEFTGRGAVAAKSAGGRYVPTSNRATARESTRPAENTRNETRTRENRPATRENAPSTRANRTAPERSTTTRPRNSAAPSSRTVNPRTESKPSAARPAPATRPRAESKPAPRREATPRTEPKREARPTPAPRANTARPERAPSHAAPSQPSRPTAQRPQPQAQHAQTTRPAPQASRPAQREAAPHTQNKPQSRQEEKKKQ